MAIGDDFKGLPMETLIGAPLTAACDANVKLAQATADFITKIGFEIGDDGKPTNTVREAKFGYSRYEQVTKEGGDTDYVEHPMNIKVPLLAIVNVPSLKVNNVDITFDMEVKSHDESKSSSTKEGAFEASASVGWGPFKASAKVSGSVSTSKENVRSTDKSAKYHVQVVAEDSGMPEGLARVLDMMNQAVTAVPASTEKKDG